MSSMSTIKENRWLFHHGKEAVLSPSTLSILVSITVELHM
jgi:hypothetical protein